MPDNEAPIEDRGANIRLTLSHIISSRQDQMFEDFDRLHGRNIDDDDIVNALRHMGEVDLLDAYAEWADIDIREDDNTTMNPVVPDPADAPSYSELTRELTAAGINADNLEQAMLTAVEANRITHGVFYAERANDGVHWHVYKRRSASDNGAYIATASSREDAQFILNSLGTGASAS